MPVTLIFLKNLKITLDFFSTEPIFLIKDTV